jgi:uncharacterized membrane protein
VSAAGLLFAGLAAIAVSGTGIEKERPLLALALCAVAAGGVATGIFGGMGGEGGMEGAGAPRRGALAEGLSARFAARFPGIASKVARVVSAARSPGASRAVAGGVVTIAATAYALILSRLTITQHRALGTRVSDLGYYDNILYQSSHGRLLGCSFLRAGYHGAAHFDPILIVLSPLHRLHPGAETLLVLQSVWLASGAFPVYFLARRVLGSRAPAVLAALAYLAYPALAGANAYDFHSLTLAVPPLLWMACCFEAGQRAGYFVALGVALLCREDVALLLCFVGVAIARAGRPGAARLGAITIAASALYFAVARAVFMPSPGPGDGGQVVKTYWWYYADLVPEGGGLRELVTTVVTRPLVVLGVVLREAKLVFVLQLFLPLAFVPLAARRGRIALLYGLAFCLLASRAAVFDIHHQYPCVLFPVLFALLPYGLRRLRDEGLLGRPGARRGSPRLLAAACGAIATASLLVSCKFGIFLPNASFRAGSAPLVRELSPEQEETYAWVKEQAARIGEQESVGVSQSLGPHVSSRMRAYFYPAELDVDWVFIDESETVGEGLGAHHRAIRSGALIEIARHGKLALFRRAER